MQILFTEFIEKLNSSYQALMSGTYRPGQIVIAVPTLSVPFQHKSQTAVSSSQDEAQGNPSSDGVDVHSFLEAALQIIHTSNDVFR